MERVGIYSTTSDYPSLEFTQPDCRDGFACLATLTENGEEYSVSLDMVDPYASDLLGFFEELSVEADGWDGEKRWVSESNEMGIVATNHREGIASFEVVMRSVDQEERRRLVLRVPADQLPQTAEQMRSLMRRSHGQRFRPQVAES